MCGFYPFSSSLIPSFPPPLPEWTWVSFSLTLSFIHFINIHFFSPLHYSSAPNIISFPIVWMDVYVCPLTIYFLVYDLVCDWSPLPSSFTLPPPFFAEGAYALGAWSGYASAGGGDWGEALCPCCFRIALAIWGHRSWTVPARQLVPHETLNLSSCACYRRKMLLYRWKSTSIWSCCVCLSFFCRAWALDLWNWTTRRWQLFPQPACRGSVGWVWACNRFHTGQVLWSNSRELLHLSVIDFTQSPLILRALYPISVRWMKIDECQWDFQNRCLHHLLSLVSVNTQTL